MDTKQRIQTLMRVIGKNLDPKNYETPVLGPIRKFNNDTFGPSFSDQVASEKDPYKQAELLSGVISPATIKTVRPNFGQVSKSMKSPADKINPIVNQKTGETLNQVVDKLKKYGWSEKDIQKYKGSILGTYKAPVKDPKKLNSVNPTGGLHVEYDPKSRMNMELADNITTLDQTLRRSPNDLITIYRGAPRIQKRINPGDFITTNYDLAKSYTGEGNVLQTKVRLSDILDDIDEPLGEEYIYRPR